jgi:hypothetical protein
MPTIKTTRTGTTTSPKLEPVIPRLQVTETGKLLNKVGELHIPTTDVKLSNGMLLRCQSIKTDIPDSGKYQILEYGVWHASEERTKNKKYDERITVVEERMALRNHQPLTWQRSKRIFLALLASCPVRCPISGWRCLRGGLTGRCTTVSALASKGRWLGKLLGYTFNTVNWAVLYIVFALGIRCSVADSQAEQFFYHIGEGDTPATNPYSAVVLDWLDEFLVGERVEKPQLVATRIGKRSEG